MVHEGIVVEVWMWEKDGMIYNPIYAGLGSFSQMISDEERVAAAHP